MSEWAFQLRPALEAEFEEIGRLERQAAQRFLQLPEHTGMTYEQLQETLEHHELERALSEGGLWVAAVEGCLAGFVATHRYPDALYIRELDVLVEYGRRGLGRALIDRAVEHAQELSLPTVFLRTFREVPWNAPYYARMGFAEVAEADWTDSMHSILEVEEQWGLLADKRLFMSRRLV